ncbi:MAG TPA: flagellar protein FlaG [Rhodocyclaceae bacterium]|nr:flagellar protein FlaG [Rhodocyclaceae bacterium]HMV52179.1 flagellar protein FlaG [Rhodocyclaceae bacterium]HNH13694.1 flagellar protein FlaG [Rhodocyclaceae bacterium]HNH97761.1 flagellar protein FlaG [Rhodocyclaceae bacterium]
MEITRAGSAADIVAADRPSARTEGVSRAVEVAEAAGLPEQQKPASKEQVEQAVKDIRKVVSTVSSDLQFSVDKDSGRTVVRVVDSKTKEVIRQIPGEEVLALRRALDKMKGVLFSMEA